MSTPTPQRTRAHIIASLSVNFVERFFLERGHNVLKTAEDYGTDLIVFTHDERGFAEEGQIYLQLKATDVPIQSGSNRPYTFPIEIKHYNQWTREPSPVFLVLYHAPTCKAYWQYIQGHFASATALKPKPGAKSVGVAIPDSNTFDHTTVDYARNRKQAILDQLKGTIRHEL